jgi:hypothetical protein
MPAFHIHRLKDHLRQPFRSAPHVSGTAMVKPRDYELGETVDAASPYAAFFSLRDSERPVEVGDLLEAENGSLRICKFVGFEEAHWVQPELKPEPGIPPAAQETAAALE